MTEPEHRARTRAHARTKAPRRVWVLPLCAGVLALAVGGRFLHDDGGEHRSASEPQRPRAAAPTEVAYRPGRVELPLGWRVVDRQGHVTTWAEPGAEDAVTVAAIESSDAPLAAVVADVASTSRRLDSAVHVDAPHELPVPRGSRGDSALLLRMTLRDPRGRELHVRQIWRRDARAAQDVVATWTSRDEDWAATPERSIPEVDVR